MRQSYQGWPLLAICRLEVHGCIQQGQGSSKASEGLGAQFKEEPHISHFRPDPPTQMQMIGLVTKAAPGGLPCDSLELESLSQYLIRINTQDSAQMTHSC